jgi:hypothetical protein
MIGVSGEAEVIASGLGNLRSSGELFGERCQNVFLKTTAIDIGLAKNALCVR